MRRCRRSDHRGTRARCDIDLLAIAAPAAAVDNGVPDGSRHPNVGLLGFDFDAEGESPPFFLCSGSVISDRAFLTAAHCIDVFDDTVQWVVSLEPGSPERPVYEPGVFPDDFPHPLTVPVHRPLATIVHPRFEPETLAHDLAVLVFPPRTFRVRPVALPPLRLLDLLRIPHIGRHATFTLAGYGADPDYSGAEPRYFVRGFRQTATAPFGALTARQLHLQGAADSGRGGLCLGDSGSPQFLAGSNLAVSLLSAVGDTCREIVAQRLDTPAEQRFLARFLR
jgi:trypsin